MWFAVVGPPAPQVFAAVPETVLLDLLWLATGAALFATLRPRRLTLQIALLCAVALLFPIISASDDFTSDGTAMSAALLTPTVLLLAVLTVIALVDIRQRPLRRVFLAAQSDPRSPPRR